MLISAEIGSIPIEITSQLKSQGMAWDTKLSDPWVTIISGIFTGFWQKSRKITIFNGFALKIINFDEISISRLNFITLRIMFITFKGRRFSSDPGVTNEEISWFCMKSMDLHFAWVVGHDGTSCVKTLLLECDGF
jgi:hypothetical protein